MDKKIFFKSSCRHKGSQMRCTVYMLTTTTYFVLMKLCESQAQVWTVIKQKVVFVCYGLVRVLAIVWQVFRLYSVPIWHLFCTSLTRKVSDERDW